MVPSVGEEWGFDDRRGRINGGGGTFRRTWHRGSWTSLRSPPDGSGDRSLNVQGAPPSPGGLHNSAKSPYSEPQFSRMTRRCARRSVRFTMRLPIRSETEAVRFVFAGGAVIAVSVVVGWLTTPLVGVAFFVVALVLGAIAYLRAPNPDHGTPFADAANEPHPHAGAAGTRRVLVVANHALSGEELRERLSDIGERVELDVLAPVLCSHLHYAVSDIDSELAEARERLDRSLAWARQSGFVARGEVGDPESEHRDRGRVAGLRGRRGHRRDPPARAPDLAGAG